MPPEINRNQLARKFTTRLQVERDLEDRQGLEFVTDVGDVDHYVTPGGGRIFVVPMEEDLNRVGTILYTEKAERHVEGFKKAFPEAQARLVQTPRRRP